MTTSTFATATRRRQIRILREAAQRLVEQYGFPVQSIELRNFGFNATFRLHSRRNRQFGLRINVNSARSRANLMAEVAWLEAIASSTEILAPRPVRNRAGDVTSSTTVDGRGFEALVYEWMEGPVVGDRIGRPTAVELGVAMATLHDHALSLRLPRSAEFPKLTSLFWNQPDRLHVAGTPLNAVQLRVLDRVCTDVHDVMNMVLAMDRHRPIHSDLHGGNLLRSAGRLGIIDFDDSGIGVPVQDIGVAAFYADGSPRFLEHLYEGYASVRPLPDVSDDTIHALMAHRNLVLLNDLLGNQTADLRNLLPKYIRRSVTRLRHYRDTGRFRLELPGLEPL